jgi:hypothetical protein
VGGICHRNLYQPLADRTFCPTPYPNLTRSLPSLTRLTSRRQFRLYPNPPQHFDDFYAVSTILQRKGAFMETKWPLPFEK